MRIRELVRSFEPYRVVEEDYPIRLDKNESPYDLPGWVKEEIFEELRELSFNRYPHITSMPAREAVASFYGLSPENVAVGNGGDELIGYLVRLFEGDYVVTTPPTFGMYSFYAKLEKVPVVEVPLREDFTIDGDAIAEKAGNARVVFIASPNNPTGNSQPEEEIVRVLDTGKPVVLDEAYAEFAGRSLWRLIEEYPNLIVLRTFSKAFSLAGVRAGYFLANEEVVDALYRIKSPFSVGIMTVAAVKVVLRHYDLVERRVAKIVEERERIRRAFREFTYPSDANFLLMRLDAYEFLLEKGIVVRKLSGRLDGHIRVTVGRKWENRKLVEALREYLEVEGCG
ncbi:histidinol-phosphate transaminase [Thermococcus thioreducens]|uniref:Histidinol-phosphate aminotransferase n=1 Tax=Thermococcus thioreducens TaxID=277988 RepID=A0A0Q2XLJ4_9EURY|nr:histidinol-phosphate transaminase [Thermococcus thioreducens]ASJ12731.1 histidinol-phosphate aminotransferase [Thermococcus thioreducens]KQH82060.1 histidinol-phosphate aminotransferase [Thermococcus thioreducens]SEV86073.1 histidinol phosphate aminotransferase apoenzyme [Thermococcus thioreducens]